MSATEIRKFMDLMESVQPEFNTIEEFAEFLGNNCRPFLEKNPDLLPLYRGSERPKKITVVDVRQDRKPMTTNLLVHDVVRELFLERGIKANRENSLFTTGYPIQARMYGSVFYCFPMGDFDFSWSPEVDDLYYRQGDWVAELSDMLPGLSPAEVYTPENLSSENFREIVSKTIGTYQTDDLPAAIRSKNEIMIASKKALLIPTMITAKDDPSGVITDVINIMQSSGTRKELARMALS